jgi:DNA-binding GntR family transcriptional regulator
MGQHECRERAWHEIERRIVCGDLAGGERLDEHELAAQLDVPEGAVREALSALERDGFVRSADDGAYAVKELTEAEVREAYPIAILLEGLAVRSTPAFPPEAVDRLRAINDEMAAAHSDPMAATDCDHRFHDELVSHCANDQLVATVRPLKRMLLRYEYAYMSTEWLVDRSVAQHGQIIDALAAGDLDGASQLAADNFRDALPNLLERLQSASVER